MMTGREGAHSAGKTRVQATHDKSSLEQSLQHEAARRASLLSEVCLPPPLPLSLSPSPALPRSLSLSRSPTHECV